MNLTLAELNLYPIKGCGGVTVTSAKLAATGLEYEGIGDREWVIVNAAGRFLSQRELPKMALIEPRFAQGALRLRAPGMLTLEIPFASEGEVVQAQVWNDTVPAVTQGEVADTWCSDYLGQHVRLLRFDPEAQRLSNPQYTGNTPAPYKFADAFAVLITNTASLDELNRRLPAPVHMNRFRANVVLDGLDAFDEDHLSEVRMGDGGEGGKRGEGGAGGQATLRPVKPCARCTVPGVDPLTGEFSNTVPDALAAFRRQAQGVMFGVNAIVTAGVGARLNVGDRVQATFNF